MQWYRLLTLGILIVLPFFPRQLHPWTAYIIVAYAVFLLPLFVRNVREGAILKKPSTIFFILFLLSSFISAFFSIYQPLSIRSFLLFFSYFIIFISLRSVFVTFKQKEKLAGLIVFVAFILSQISLYYTLLLQYVNVESEGVSFMWVYYGHNHLSTLLLFAIPLGFYFLNSYWSKRTYRFASFFVLFILLFSLFFTFARASVVSLVLAGVGSTVLFRSVLKYKLVIILFLPLLIVSVVIGLSIIHARDFGVGKYELKWSSRTIYWQQAFDNAEKHPFFGSGLDTFRIVNRKSEREGVIKTYYTHNFFFQMLSDAGLFGFFTSGFLIFSVLLQSFEKIKEKVNHYLHIYSSSESRAKSRESREAGMGNRETFLLLAFWVGLLASTLNSVVDFDWQLSVVFLVFWVIAGLVLDF